MAACLLDWADHFLYFIRIDQPREVSLHHLGTRETERERERQREREGERGREGGGGWREDGGSEGL